MKLPFLTGKKDTSQYYLALLLTDEKAHAVILQEEEGTIEILNQHTEFFSSPLDDAPLEELIDIIDKAISRAEEILPPNIETHKTVFGVKDDWVEPESKKITKEHLAQLKKVCSALDLSPIGFMVVSEAISHLMQKKEGAPFSAVLVDLGKKRVTLRLIRAGRVVETVQGDITESIPETIDTLLKHFTTEVLPARIVIVHEQQAEPLSKQFAHHEWNKSIPFLHKPTIELLPKGFDGKAVTYGAAAQMGFEVTDKELAHEKAHTVPEEQEAPEEEPNKEKDADSEDQTAHEEPLPPTPPIAVENFGFVTDQDITMTPKTPHHEVKKQHEEVSPLHHEVKQEHHAPHHAEKMNHEASFKHHEPKALHEAYESNVHPVARPQKKRFAVPNIRMPHIAMPDFSSFGKNKIVMFPVALILLVIIVGGGSIFWYITQVKAAVVVMVEPKMVDATTEVLFSTSSSSDFSQHTIAARSITTQVEGQATTDATGKKDVGEKAKGTVTIYNNDSDKVSLDEGTKVETSNGLTFVLDKSVSIASQSGDIFSGTKPGTADVSVTATEIGTDYNMPSNTKFAVGGNSQLAAKNDSAFSGGSKKSVTVVAKADIANLKKSLPKSLEEKAKAAIAQEGESGETVLPLIEGSVLSKEVYNKDVGEEAKTVQLKAIVSFEGLAYKDSELTNYAKLALKDEYSDSVSFADGSITANVQDAKQAGEDEVEATLQIEGGLLPNLKPEDILRKIEGKSPKQAKETITALPQVAESDITFSPSIPFLSLIAPRLPNSVSVQITSKN